MDTRYVVVGSGYAGALAAIRLAWRARRPGAVTLVDPSLQLVERVRLHEAVVSGREVAHSMELLAQRVGIALVAGTMVGLDDHAVLLEGGRSIPFDACVLALGSRIARTIPGSVEHAMALDAGSTSAIRQAVSRADRVLVIGGGLTGIELASELAEVAPHRHVCLAARTLAGGLSPRARAYAKNALDRLGVEQVVGAAVDEIERGSARVGDRCIGFDLAIDTSGFVGAAPAFLGGPRDASGRVCVDAALRLPGRRDVIVAGDVSVSESPFVEAPAILGCQSAMPAGAHAADVAFAIATGGVVRPFAFRSNGYCVSLGRRDGVIDFAGGVLTGRTAAWIKEAIVRYTMFSMSAQARGWDYRWRPFGGAARAALQAPSIARLPA